MASQITLGKMYLPGVCDPSNALRQLFHLQQYPQSSSIATKSFKVLKIGLIHSSPMQRQHYNKGKLTRVLRMSGYLVKDDLRATCLKAYDSFEKEGMKLVDTDEENVKWHDDEEFGDLEEEEQFQDDPQEYEKESILGDEEDVAW